MKDIVEALTTGGWVDAVVAITTFVVLVVIPAARWVRRKGRAGSRGRLRPAGGLGARVWGLLMTPMYTAKVSGWGQWVEKLQMTVRSGCGVPLAHKRVDSKLASFVRLIRRSFFIHDTSPKPAFEIAAWGYHPVGGMEMEVVYNLSEGFILHIELAEGELARHLKKSIEARAQLAEAMVVVAPLESLYDRNAQVRCFLVDTSNVGLGGCNPKKIAFASAIPNSNGQQPARSMLNRQVPPRAVWLVCDDPNAKELKDGWWASHAEGKAAFRDTDESSLEYVNLTVRRMRKEKLELAAMVFPLPAVMLWLIGLVEPDFRSAAWLTAISWMVLVSYFLLFILGCIVLARVRSWYWLRVEKTKRDKWRGRTTRCIAAGIMVRGVALSDKKWPALFEVLDQ